VAGHGARIVLEDGRELVDGTGQGSSAILGHQHPELIEAVSRAASAPILTEVNASPLRDEAAELLFEIAFTGEAWAGAVRFCTSATEAIDLGLFLAQTVTGRAPLVARDLAYHGAAGLARDAGTHPLWFGGLASRTGGWQTAPGHAQPRRLPVPSCGSGETGDCTNAGCRSHCFDDAVALLSGAAAVVSDFGSGAIYPSPTYQDQLAQVAHETGTYWLQDEAVTGFGRLGCWFSFQRANSRPDMVALGKAFTGGAVPGGALVLSEDLVAEIGDRRWQTGSTLRGNPVTLAAMTTVLRIVERDELVARAHRLGTVLGDLLTDLASAHPSVERVGGEGLLWSIELRADRRHAANEWRGDGADQPFSKRVSAAAVDHGALVSTSGGSGLWLAPPLVIEEDELRLIANALDAALSEVEQREGSIS
jgi:4-aminobutyrate aminotransferase-like enzyme